jgi:hypothetical protein
VFKAKELSQHASTLKRAVVVGRGASPRLEGLAYVSLQSSLMNRARCFLEILTRTSNFNDAFKHKGTKAPRKISLVRAPGAFVFEFPLLPFLTSWQRD